MGEIIIVILITAFVLLVRSKIKSHYDAKTYIRDVNRAYREKRSSTRK